MVVGRTISGLVPRWNVAFLVIFIFLAGTLLLREQSFHGRNKGVMELGLPDDHTAHGAHEGPDCNIHQKRQDTERIIYEEEMRHLADYYVLTAQENMHRKRHLAEACHTLNMPERDQIRTLINADLTIAYCRVNKCASTFHLGILREVFGCDRECLRQNKDAMKLLPWQKRMVLLDHAYSYMFVREPYGRFYSYYCNKYYLSKENWAPSGPTLIKKYRENPSALSLKYGHDLTFTEMLKNIIVEFNNGEIIDEHLRPMNFNCDPCQMRYDFIGKIETLPTDYAYLIHRWEAMNLTKPVPKELAYNLSSKLLYKPVHNLHRTLKLTKGSDISVYSLFIRTWSYFQLHGKVSKSIPMPFDKYKVDTVSMDEYQEALASAIERSKTIPGLKDQKMEAMRQLYATVPMDILEQLQEVVSVDCQLFDYETRPTFVFVRNGKSDTSEQFDYFKGVW